MRAVRFLVGRLLGLSAALLVCSGLLARPAAADEPIYIDVRTPGEFATGAIDGAINIPHTEIAERISEITTEKDADLRLYCKSGGRSGLAKKTLESMGYTSVTNEGGYEALKKKLTASE